MIPWQTMWMWAVNGETLEKFIDSGCSVVTKDNAQERLDKLKGYIG